MEISQLSFAVFCAASFVAGAAVCVFYCAFALLPAACGRVYSKKMNSALKRIRCVRPFEVNPSVKKIALHISVFLHDFLIAVAAGTLLTLVIYRFNDGVFRVAAPICFVLGFVACRALLSRVLAPISELLGFILRYLFFFVSYLALLPWRWLKKVLHLAAERISAAKKKHRARRFALSEKRRLLATASLNGCLDTSCYFNEREVLKNGKKKIKYDSSLGDRRNTSPFGDRKLDKYNALQSENERSRKAIGGKRDTRGKDRGNAISP